MRIVAGRHRGARLEAPPGEATRPTSDRARQALFDTLTGGRFDIDLDDAIVLDLFAGTGALGLEALSRGAARAIFVEKDRAALAVLNRNGDRASLLAHPPADYTGDGIPDLLMVWKGRAIFAEFKVDGGKLSPAQRDCHAGLMLAGALVVTIRSLDEFIDFMNVAGIPIRSRIAA